VKRSMVAWVRDYLAHRRSLGYELRTEGQLLLEFGRYVDRQTRGRARITQALALQWARRPRRAARAYWARRLSVVRALARYCAAFEKGHQIPPSKVFGPAHPRHAPHLYTPTQIKGLLKAARLLPGFLRPHTFATLFVKGSVLSIVVFLHLIVLQRNRPAHQQRGPGRRLYDVRLRRQR